MDASALMIALNTSLPRTPAYVTLLHGSESIQTLYIFFGAKRSKLYYLPLRSLWAHKVTSGSQVRAEQVKVPARDAEIAAVHEAAAADASNALAETGYRSSISAEKMTTTLTRAEFDYAIEILRGSDFPIEVEIEDAWEMFSRIRATYEFPMYALLRRLDATPAPWTGPRNTPTPVMWPTLATDLLEQGKSASAKSPDASSNQPAPDAPNP
jgi:hypothetical protein